MSAYATARDQDPAALALASLVSDRISTKLGEYLHEMALRGMTKQQLAARLRQAMEAAERE